ncbi:MAG: helix-turn-helix domain-containing protein [Deltaproteobacteria bacterium]|nr:helix-turn-helix domain-containing protein [Deltaproteobacteria bacterium]
MKLLTLEEVADQLATTRSTARRLLIAGRIPSITIGSGRRKKLLRVRPEVLTNWILSQERASKNKVQGG